MDNKNVFWKSKFAILGFARGDYGIITLKNSLSPRPFWWDSDNNDDNFINGKTHIVSLRF